MPDLFKTPNMIAVRPKVRHGNDLKRTSGQTSFLHHEMYIDQSDVLQIEIETDNLINESFEVDDFTQRFRKVCG